MNAVGIVSNSGLELRIGLDLEDLRRTKLRDVQIARPVRF